jgi:hypothetical protein
MWKKNKKGIALFWNEADRDTIGTHNEFWRQAYI